MKAAATKIKVKIPVAPIPNEPVQKHSEFRMVCNDMYKRFGAVYTNLKVLARTDGELSHLTTQLRQLRDAMRELLDQAGALGPKEVDK